MSDWIPSENCAYNVKRIPRVVTKLMRNASGGYMRFIDRRGKEHTIDTVPAHAVKTDNDFVQANGVCMPIRRQKNTASKA